MADPALIDFQAYKQIADLRAEFETFIKGTPTYGGGSGSGGGVQDDPTDLKIALAESRTDNKILRLEGKIDGLAHSISALSGKIDAQRTDASSNRNVVVTTVITVAIALAGLLFAMLSYGASTFYNGTVVRDIVHNEIGSKQNSQSGTGH